MQGSAGAQTLYLMHWDGTSWTQVSLNYPTSDVDYMAQDGHGGIWMVANGPAPDYAWNFYHLNAGKWTMSSVPAGTGLSLLDLTGLSWVPGTRSMWATGNMVNHPGGNDIYGAILRYGS